MICECLVDVRAQSGVDSIIPKVKDLGYIRKVAEGEPGSKLASLCFTSFLELIPCFLQWWTLN